MTPTEPRTYTDAAMAQYVRDHQCWAADRNVTIADWHRGIRLIEAEAAAAERERAVRLEAVFDRLRPFVAHPRFRGQWSAENGTLPWYTAVASNRDASGGLFGVGVMTGEPTAGLAFAEALRDLFAALAGEPNDEK